MTVASYERRVWGDVSRASSERMNRRSASSPVTPSRHRRRRDSARAGVAAHAAARRVPAPDRDAPAPGSSAATPSAAVTAAARPPPRAGRCSAAGFGRTARQPQRRRGRPRAAATVAPQVRHSPASPRRAIAPLPSSWTSWIAPVGSSLRREVALRVVRAPPEDVAGPPRATRHEVAVAVLGAHDLERQLVGRRRAVLADVRAVRVARAADERRRTGRASSSGCPRRTGGTASPSPSSFGRLLARQRPRLLVLGVRRAGEERPLRPRRMTIGWPSEHTSSVGLGREVGPLELAALLVDARLERRSKNSRRSGTHSRSPRATSSSSSSIRAVNSRSTYSPKCVDEQVRDDLADLLGVQAPLLDPDVAAVDDRRDRRRVGRRPADAVLLERLDQRRLGVPRRRLGEVLGRGDVDARA